MLWVSVFWVVMPVVAIARPNFVVIVFDDMGWQDMGAYGNPHIKTPVMDRLAAGGALFRHAFLTSSSCTASRASLLTARYPHSTGIDGLGETVPQSQVLLPSLLRQSGYFTAALGKWHIGNATRDQFDRVEDDTGNGTSAWLPTLRALPEDQPFFLWLATHDPHVPYAPLDEHSIHSPEAVLVPPYLPDTSLVRDRLARYYNEIARTDAEIGRVIELLQQRQLMDTTWVFILSDNGAPFPRAKLNLYDSGIKTPLLVTGPNLEAGVREGMVSAIDLMPTILDLAGVALPDSIQGKSFRSLLEVADQPGRDFIVAEQNAHGVPIRKRAVRTREFLYIRNLQQSGKHCSFEAGLHKHLAVQQAAGQLTHAQQSCLLENRPEEELYRVQDDPYSMHNLADDARHRDGLQAMRDRMAQWAADTADTAWLDAGVVP